MKDKNCARIKRRRRLPRNIASRPGREIMELIFGRRIVREIHKVIDELNSDKRSSQALIGAKAVTVDGDREKA